MIGRTAEMKMLREVANADRSRFVVVYGRRRVGKTYLIRETFDYRFSFTHTGMESGLLEEQLHAFHQSLLEQGLGECDRPSNWIDAFGLLKKLLKSCPDERKIVFIDELPWMDTPRSRFVSALENFWNGWCAARKEIVLIVCGSATSWMIKTVLRNKGGLFNRANRVICLEPFTLAQCEAYMRERGAVMSRRELAEGYMVFGGSPYYWSLLDTSMSIAQNVDRLCFTSAGELVGEFKRLYSSIFRKSDKHLKVVDALYDRREGLTSEEISKSTAIPATGKLTRIFKELEESGFLRQYAPMGRRKRGSVYQLMDNFTIFHAQFMAGRSPAWRRKSLLGAVQRCKENRRDADRYAHRQKGWRCQLCEMKFSRDEFAIGDAYAKKLRERTELFRSETGTRKSIHLTFVTSFGVKRNENSDIVQSQVTLDDLFK